MSRFEPPFTASDLYSLILDLDLTKKEFSQFCGKNNAAWATQQTARGHVLTFSNAARGLFGYMRARYSKLNQNFVVDDETKDRAKALLLDQIMADVDHVVKIAGSAPNQAKLLKENS